MKKAQRAASLVLGALLGFSMLAVAGCSDESAETVTAARICYDNLGKGYLSSADTTYTLKNVTSVAAVNGDGKTVDASAIATQSGDTFTAVGEGVLTCTLKDGSKFRIEVTPAYVTNPGNQYTGTASDYSQGGSQLGACHDPSLIEVEEDGKPVYYIFSTGWAYGNEIRRSDDGMMTWQYMGKSMSTKTQMADILAWEGTQNTTQGLSWWAPDIVKAPDGGYWLYTCCVTTDDSAFVANGITYSKACITLFHSETLEAESFEYVGVLMQSCIPEGGEGSLDVNSIDPQIIYDESGKMYMAYGSFGTGNWMLELDPKTGLRKDGVYSDGVFLDYETVRGYRDEAVKLYASFKEKEIKHNYYGTMISYGQEEAPVIARHSNVKVADETATYDANGEPEGVKGKTYFYSMHSYNPLDTGYQMWGGRSENVWGKYCSVNGGYSMNYGAGNNSNGGNKYTGSFTWADKSEGNTSTDIIFPGHNDLFTTSAGTNIAAYITRTASYAGAGTVFIVQLHQYYLNSLGDICINQNRYASEIDRSVSADELFACTKDGQFKMVVLANDNTVKTSEYVTLQQSSSGASSGDILKNGAKAGTWVMYGKGYIKFVFDERQGTSDEYVYYGVVRPAWLDDQNRSGFTIACMGHSPNSKYGYNTAMFMNSVSSIEGDGLVG